MVKQKKIPVVDVYLIGDAQDAAASGNLKRAAALLHDFAWRNGTLRQDRPYAWAMVKCAALTLRGAAGGTAAAVAAAAEKARQEIVRHVYPAISIIW